jgi:hypothetical protein
MINIGGQGTGLTEIIVAMQDPEMSLDESTSEGALWSAILSLRRGCGERQDKTMSKDRFVVYVGPIIGPMLPQLK